MRAVFERAWKSMSKIAFLLSPDIERLLDRESQVRVLCNAFSSDYIVFSIVFYALVCHERSFSVSSSIHVECSASFCPFFHIIVTVQKSTQDRTIRAFIPAILLNLSQFLFRDLEVFGFTSC